MRIYAVNEKDGKHYRLHVTTRWAIEHDNFMLQSAGLTIPRDLSERALNGLIKRQQAFEVTADEYNHSGCKSRCVKRGDDKCQW